MILVYVSSGMAVIGGVATSLVLELPQVAGLIAGMVWLGMAAALRTGRPWAGLTAIFVFGLGTLVTVVELLGELAYPNYVGLMPGLIIFEVLQWLPALTAVVLLLRTREVAGFFRQLRAGRVRPPDTRSGR